MAQFTVSERIFFSFFQKHVCLLPVNCSISSAFLHAWKNFNDSLLSSLLHSVLQITGRVFTSSRFPARKPAFFPLPPLNQCTFPFFSPLFVEVVVYMRILTRAPDSYFSSFALKLECIECLDGLKMETDNLLYPWCVSMYFSARSLFL